MKKLGLTLAGGGAKGAYQVGVWKYLTEIGLADSISVIAGTSVGALNTVLFCTTDCQMQNYIWTNEVSFSTMMDFVIPQMNSVLGEWGITLPEKIPNSIFSRDGLIKIIEKYIVLDSIQTDRRHLYAACYCRDTRTTKFFRLNNYEPPIIQDIILASSALPYIYSPVNINGCEYIDGGVIPDDNIPITPLKSEHCSDSIIVTLSHDASVPKPPSTAVVIRPSENIGGPILGMMNFTAEKAAYLIKLGYNDMPKYDSQLSLLCRKYCLHRMENVSLQSVIDPVKTYLSDHRLLEDEIILLLRQSIDGSDIYKISSAVYSQDGSECRQTIVTRYALSMDYELSSAFGDKDMVVVR